MIEIFNTLIDEKFVTGVSPLFTKYSADQTIVALYNERQFYFTVYTRYYPFVVSTDWLSFKAAYKEESERVQSEISDVRKTLRACLLDGCFNPLLVFYDHDRPKNSPDKEAQP